MPEFIGNVEVPEVEVDGVFPLLPNYGMVTVVDPQIITHLFGAANAKREQNFKQGPDLRRFIIDQEVWEDEREELRDFWEDRKGSHQPFIFNLPLEEGGSTEEVTCVFADAPLSWEFMTQRTNQMHIELQEVSVGAGPVYALEDTITIPDIGEWKRAGRDTGNIAAFLADALLEQAQVMIPLVRIRPRLADYPEIFLSDRRVTVDGVLYQPRLQWQRCDGIGQIAVGLPGGDEAPDDVTLIFGDADRVMRELANDVRLDLAFVEVSAFHVGTGIKLVVWAGEVQAQGWEAQPPDFVLRCSDPIASPNMLVPDREITRKCPWLFDSIDCPFSDSEVGGSMDLVHFPAQVGEPGDSDYEEGSNPATCDRGYDTKNGCLAHGMKYYFGGVLAVPQAVRVKDNSTGVWGFGRSWMTSVSMIADSVYGIPLPEIYTDILMPVPAYLISGRDEGDFYEALGIVGEGPLGRFGVGHKLDGEFHHGYPGPLGLHTVLGTHPAGPNDFLSLDQSGNQTNGDFRKVFAGASTFLDNFSAGVAFVVLRKSDPKGRQLTRLSEHSMQVFVEWGLGGWVWTEPGVRVWTEHLTNPIWIMIRRHLRTMGVLNGTVEQQEAVFDVRAAIYHGEICDLEVPRLVGEGTETQFKFIGRVEARRPHRSWLNDIGQNALAYYRNSAGKLSVGVRVNSSALAAFTEGNMILDSLRLASHGTEGNRVTCTFSDVYQEENSTENQFVANTARAQDDDFARELGGGVRAVYRDINMNLGGTCNISQAQRIANTVMREEVGGVNAEERGRARRAIWQTTIMAMDVEAGDVVSNANAEIPGGTGEFRIYRWRLRPDWSIEIEGRTVCDSMYDFVNGPKPADILADPVPPELYPDPLRQVWHPFHVRPIDDDAVYDQNEYTFFLAENNDNDTQMPFILITGALPVNTFLPNVQPPSIRRAVASGTGGVLPAGKRFTVCICTWQRLIGYSPHSNFLKVVTPDQSEDTCSITIDRINWPAGDFDDGGYVIFAGMEDDRLICDNYAIYGPNLPASLVFAGPYKRSTWNLPGVVNRKVVAKATLVEHSGPGIPVQVTEIDSEGRVTCEALAGSTSDDFEGRILSVIHSGGAGEPDPEPVLTLVDELEAAAAGDEFLDSDGKFNADHWNFYRNQLHPPDLTPEQFGLAFPGMTDEDRGPNISAEEFVTALEAVGLAGVRSPGVPDEEGSETPYAGVYGHGSAPLLNFLITSYDADTGTFELSPDPVAAGLGLGDLVVVRFRADIITDNSIGDTGFDNSMMPGGNLADEKGKKVWIIAGPGRGQARIVLEHTNVEYRFAEPWDPLDMPTADSIWIVVDAAWTQRAEVVVPPTRMQGFSTNIILRVPNNPQRVWAVIGIIEDRQAGETPEELAFVREIFVPGGPGSGFPIEDLTTWQIATNGTFDQLQVLPDCAPISPVRKRRRPTSVVAALKVPSAGSSVILDMNYITPPDENGDRTDTGSIFADGDKLIIPAGSNEDHFQANIRPDLILEIGGRLTLDIDQVGSTTRGRVLTVILKGTVVNEE